MEDLLQHFQTVYSNVENDDTQAETQNILFTENMLDPDLDSDISLEELKRSVFHKKKNASYGPDNVCSEAIKASFDIISPFFLLKLVNQIINSGDYPDSWGRGIIAPIFKSGDDNQAKNYRGITISNILSKVYSQMLLNRLMKLSEKYEVLGKNQFGFQKGKSTADCIFSLV